MDDVFTEAWFDDAIALIDAEIRASAERTPQAGQAFVRHAANHHSVPAAATLHNEVLHDFVRLRQAFLRRQIDAAEGEAYTASVDLGGHAAGDRLLLTDPGGWTIAALELRNAPSDPGVLRIQVEADPGSGRTIDRVWQIDNGGSSFDARVSLFYRNDLLGLISARSGNWLTTTMHPTQNQWQLRIARLTDYGAEALTAPQVNPISNRVDGDLSVEPGTTELVVTTDP